VAEGEDVQPVDGGEDPGAHGQGHLADQVQAGVARQIAEQGEIASQHLY
jgi:hypothetical protein